MDALLQSTMGGSISIETDLQPASGRP